MGFLDKFFKKRKSDEEYLDFSQNTQVYIKDSDTQISTDSAVKDNFMSELQSSLDENTETNLNHPASVKTNNIATESYFEKTSRRIRSFISRNIDGTKSPVLHSMENVDDETSLKSLDEVDDNHKTIVGSFDTVKMKIPVKASGFPVRKLLKLSVILVILVAIGLLFIPDAKKQDAVETKFIPKTKKSKPLKSKVIVNKLKKNTKKKKKRVASKKYLETLKKRQTKVLTQKLKEVKEIKKIKLAESLEDLDTDLDQEIEKSILKEEKKGSSEKKYTREITKPAPRKVIAKKKVKKIGLNYLMSGRNLVYNCHGRHWACIASRLVTECKNSDGSCRFVNEYQSKASCYNAQTKSINKNRKVGC